MKRPEGYTRSSFRPLAKLRTATVITGGHRMTLTLQRGRALVDTGNKLTVFELQRRNCSLATVNKRANEIRCRCNGLSGLWRREHWLYPCLQETKAELLRFFPEMGSGAPADEVTVGSSPDPFGAVAAAPPLVAGVLNSLDGDGCRQKALGSPTSARIVLDSLKRGKNPEATVQFSLRFLV